MNIFRRFTWQSLKKNKVRTIVTIIGIVLSVTMITAVTTTVSSMQDFMLRVVVQNDGCWHGVFKEISGERGREIEEKEEVEKSGALQNVGYARLKDVQNESKPFLYVGAYTGDYTNLVSVHLLEGRLPQNSSEIILPKFLQDNGGIQYKTGDELTLDMGIRKDLEGTHLWQKDTLSQEGSKRKEVLQPLGKQKYRVVGIYDGGASEGTLAPGYTVLTKADDKVSIDGETLYVTLHEPKNVSKFLEKNKKGAYATDTNSSYLTYSGNSDNDNIQDIMNNMMMILIGIIMFGSIALIYNSFSISVMERKKQYGLLSSIGATRKQLKRSILFESVVLSAIGIPLGVLAGIGGMAVTFYFLSDIFERFINSSGQAISLQMSASVASIIIAVVVGFITVLISAYLPARKALKISAIEAIRQSDDIRIKPKKLRTSYVTQRFFGLEGILASKNFKRNKRKYRATVFSLFISIVLFISASSFCDYMAGSLQGIVEHYRCDLQYSSRNLKAEKIYSDMVRAKGVTEASYSIMGYTVPLLVSKAYMTEDYKETVGLKKGGDRKIPIDILIMFMEDASYEKFLSENHFDKSIYMRKEKPTALVVNKMKKIVGSVGQSKIYHGFKEDGFAGKLLFSRDLPKDYEVSLYDEEKGKWDKEGNPIFTMEKWEYKKEADGSVSGESVPGSAKDVTMEQAYEVSDVQVGEMVDEVPPQLDMYTGSCPILLYPRSALKSVCKNTKEFEIVMSFLSDQPEKSYQEMCTILRNYSLSTDSMQNIDKRVQANEAVLTLVQVFSYGFIILISLIAMANVFNTISTNVALRRREFAMLRSVGMTQKGFRRMMNYECLLYGLKGILYGLPVAIGVTFLIYQTLSGGADVGFYIPWYSVVIAVGSVFLVVFATMLYSMNKIRKDNVVDTLKNENY